VSAAAGVRPGTRIHLIAVGGVGMSALAGLLQARGARVTGSDEHVYPPASTLLAQLGIEVRPGYRPEHVADAEVVVVGNAVTRANPEVVAASERGLPLRSLPQLLGEVFLAERVPLVVAGTHGKTTSSAMLAWVLDHAGRRPGFMIGGAPVDFAASFRLGEGPHFVVEGDEYDSAFFDKGPKFLHYRPRAVLLTAVEFDHADIYRDLDDVKEAFRRLVALVPPDAPLVVASDFPHAVEVAAGAAAPIFFGDAPLPAAAGATRPAVGALAGFPRVWRATGVRDDGRTTAFEVEADGRTAAAVRLQVPGVINVRNALGVFVLARALGLGAPETATGLASFRGVRRRQELVGEAAGVTVIDDFAHHPTAVAGTLAALRARYPARRLVAVFEPRSNTSRRRIFQREFANAFAAADAVVLSAVHAKPNDPIPAAERFSPEDLVADLHRRGVEALALPSPVAIAAHLAAAARPGDVIAVMSNGEFGGLPRRLIAALEETHPDARP
jgi:UDP-N-acetylmuramate: L-alanyl-gamma-D-glutamyl-meso-diaminopimelate ligase